jgi:type I restriction enzyme S subunit
MKVISLPEVAKIIMGQSPPSSSYNTKGEGLPFFQGKADFGDLYPTVRMFCTEPNKIAQVGDILISVRAPVGPTNLAPERCCIGRGLAAIRGSKNIKTQYLLYFLRSYEPELAERGTGSTFDAISRSDLEAIHLPLPPLDEQKRIAAILSKADRLRRLRRYARELSDGYLGSVFLEMFGDPVSNPMGWDITSLGEICSLIRDGVHETPPYVPSGVPFITVKNIVTGRLDFQNTNFVSEEVHSELTRRVKPERGDILVSKDGTIGVPCVVDTDREFSIFVSVALLKPRRRIVDPIFLVQQIRSDAVQRQIRQGTKGITIRHLHLEDFKRLIVLLPPLKHQREFVRIVHKSERLRAQQREAERQAEYLFQSLLSRAFRGEL